MQLKDGTLLANFFKWRRGKTKEELEGFGQLAVSQIGELYADIGTFVVRSSNNGYTWDKSPTHFEISGHKVVSTSAPALECNDGTILLPVYTQPVIGNSVMIKSAPSLVVKSFDNGRTWVEPTLVAADPEGKVALEEPTLVQLKSGKIICMIRASSGGGDYLRQAESFDNGKTWTKFWRTPIIGHPPHLLQLTDGRILCTYGYRHPPFGIRACLSEDEGKTWNLKKEIVIRDDGLNTDLGYPSSIEISSAEILAVYYFHDENDTRFISGTLFNVPASVL